jgi:ATP-binding cassette subfamily B multidrug efflux pump
MSKESASKGTVKRLLEYISRKRGKLIIIFVLVVLSAIFNVIGPYLIGKAIDDYIIPKNFKGLAVMLLFMAVVYFLGVITTWLQNYAMIGVAQDTVKNLRKDLFEKLQTLPLSFFDTRSHGDIMSRLTNDVDNVSNTLNSSVTSIFSSIITLVGTFFMMLYLNLALTAITVITVPTMIFVTKKIAKKTRAYFNEQQAELGKINGFIEETISGQKVVKVFNREQKGISEFENHNRNLRNIGIRAQSFSGIVGPISNMLNNITYALIAGVGGYLALKGWITIGIIASFINYAKQFGFPINNIANQYNLIQTALSGAERVFEVMDEEPELEDIQGAYDLKNSAGQVELKEVTFSYKKGRTTLKNVNISVEAGKTIALVGPTGAGKTTIINLLTRFYDIDRGKILIDGQDICNIKRNSLRSALGIVLQETYLFSASVRENIRYGKLDATDEEIERAAKVANAHTFISRLQNGYDTILNEDGSNLSQGQKQLISIARAILADPSILILDEATSSVDTRTEVHIQEAMIKLMNGRTSFVIAHRLSTIRNADSILVVNDGEIIERGSHEQLLNKKGFYYKLYNSQFRKKIG